MMRKLIDIVLFSLCSLALAGCPDNKSSEDIGPASGGTSAGGETGPDASPPDEPVRPEAMPMLCTIDGGKWCPSPCPSGDAGSLCCSDVCVPLGKGELCGGAVGWCSNYTTSTTPAGGKVSTCHDAP